MRRIAFLVVICLLLCGAAPLPTISSVSIDPDVALRVRSADISDILVLTVVQVDLLRHPRLDRPFR